MGFIEQIATYIQKYAPMHDIQVCSPIIAQAVLESASGTSELAVYANNYFGLKYRAGRCPTSCGIYHKRGSEQNPDGTYTAAAMQWMKFPDMESGVQGYFDFINVPAYANLKGVTVPETYLTNIRQDGYATSLKYVENLMSVISRYNLTKYDMQTEVIKPMSLNIQTLPANPANYGGSRNASSILYLIYHYTANKTDKAASNANYFRNNIVRASAHYFVDEHDIYQSVEDLKTAYSVGGAKWSDCGSTGGGSMYGRITNANSISIEMCSSNGAISEATIQNAVNLGKKLMEKYHIPISNVYRHFDVNGKHCPGWQGWYGPDSSKWTEMRNRLSGAACPDSSAAQAGSSYLTGSACPDSSAAQADTAGLQPPASPTSPTDQTSPKACQVRLLDNLNIRKSPNGAIVQANGARKGVVYTIVETQGSWGRLKSGAGWINISDRYVRRI